MTSIRFKGLVAIGCVAAVGLSACSSSDDSGGGPATTGGGSSSSSAPQPAGSPIKVGLVVGLSGTEQTMMASVPDVASSWESMVNDAGGIGGHPVQVVTVNTKGDPAVYQSALKTLVEKDKVAAILTSDDVSESSGGAYLEQMKVPVIGANGTDLSIWGARSNYFQMTQSIPSTLIAQAQVAKAIGAENFGTVVCAEVSACLQAQALFKPAAEGLGLKWTGIVTAAASAPNYTAQCLSLIQNKTDFISLAIQSTVTQRVVPDCLQQNYSGKIGVNANGFVQSVEEKLTGAHFAGNLEAFPWWVDAAPVKQFRDAMEKYKPKADYRTGNATGAWAALMLFKYAIGTPAGDVTPQVVTAAYTKLKDVTLDGLLPQPITFTAGKPAPKVNCYWAYTFDPGDKNPKSLQIGTSGNGATGDLATACTPSS